MKVISVWQPFASLLVEGYKIFETRTWPAPQSLIGQPLGIAATKSIVPGQKEFIADETFRGFYDRLGWPKLIDMPRGCLLGSVTLDSVELMTEELMDDVSAEEQAYGHWTLGNYAWRCTNPVKFDTPIPIVGKQGLYTWEPAPNIRLVHGE